MPFTTRITLLNRVIKDGDDASWTEFYEKYEDLIRLYGKKRGLTKDEREDLVQNVMLELSRKDLVKIYDKSRGPFRAFLWGITRFQSLRIKDKRKDYVSLDALEYQNIEPSVNNECDEIWNDGWKHDAQIKALKMLKSRVEPKTYQAFHLYAMQERPIQEVASFLGMSKECVYQHKHRCLQILKETVSNLEEL